MNIKTRITALCLATALLASMLSGCGAEQAENSSQADQTAAAQPLAASTSSSLPFTDVPADADYAQAVAWCYQEGLMQGTSTTAFSPNGTLTRAMVATVLYRVAGEPAVSGDPAFTDTQPGQWYSDAVVWANSRAIVRGYGDGMFGTGDPVTHEQLDMMIRRYKGEDPEWTGDLALSAAATRAEAAEAFYANLSKGSSAGQGHKTLVAYFSRTGENYGVGVIEKGNTHIIADMVANQTEVDTFEIATVTPYSDNYDECTAVARRERDEKARPELTAAVDNLADYDVIFLGYPIWWGDMPMAVYTFLESYDFEGKTIVPFCTHAGSGLSGTVGSIKAACPGATVLDGLAVAGTTAQNDQPAAEKAVTDWLNASGLLAKAETGDGPVVYMTTDISPEGLLAVYEALDWTPTGKVAVKLSTSEPPASNYLRPDTTPK